MTTLYSSLSKQLPRPAAIAVLAVTYLLCLFLTIAHLGYNSDEPIVYFDYGLIREE